jgi:hypothetical protein
MQGTVHALVVGTVVQPTATGTWSRVGRRSYVPPSVQIVVGICIQGV